MTAVDFPPTVTILSGMRYRVFVRNWWRWKVSTFSGERKLVPNSGDRGRRIAWAYTETEAREICHQYNTTHKPGKLSKKAEYKQA